ncbi:hypothetical protein SmJEL517_g04919 [Synchytrium microbalum]|uniref:Tyrosine-protein phosphatase domain-containing protein n=1 Tax=Synchytrium microbalum TaxID=1806994 RepID=A0A507BXJ5_9FUNG|nr:uncharacterized protein SmJEL517_g04919 [Synchytrium microbalum]TPX31858.1 hypothetical protein SmJEL517_g04919 [Synchytrium microbalum]
MSVLTPPDSFGIVERGLFRSNMFNSSSFSFIKPLGLKTCLVLSTDPPSRSLLGFFEDCGTKFVHLGSHPNSRSLGWRPVSEELIKDGLELILDKANYPVLVMCTSGIHETGIFVGCLRKLQRWNFNSIVVEYRSFAGNKARYVNEQFIELFDLDLVTIPQNQPLWFLDQQRTMAEEDEEALRSSRTSMSSTSTGLPPSMPDILWRRASASRIRLGSNMSSRRTSNLGVPMFPSSSISPKNGSPISSGPPSSGFF